MRIGAIAAVFACALQGAVPAIESIYPRAIQKGKTATVYLRGSGLTRGAQLQTQAPASFAHMTASRDPLSKDSAGKPGSVLPFLVSVPPDAQTGVFPVRIKTRAGISNLVLFSVSDLTEVEEAESLNPEQSNHTPDGAQKLSAGTIVNGTLVGADVDLYQFQAALGQRLVLEVESRRIGSAIDPAIEIVDATGRVVAANNDAPGLDLDCRLEAKFPKPGRYFIRVHDASYSDQSVNFYRLRAGTYNFADAMFPLGWKRGEPVEVSFAGGNLAKPVTVRAETNKTGPSIPVSLPGAGTIPLRFVLSDSKEAIEPARLEDGLIANGRLEKPGESDRYELEVKPGQKWVLSMAAAALGTSMLDGVIVVRDAEGKVLARQDDGDGTDPILPFTVPEKLERVTVSVEDLLGRGGANFGYRLQARQHGPDFLAELLTPYVNIPAGGTAQVACLIRRQGYDGEIRLRIPNLPQGYHSSGGHVPDEAAQQSFNDTNAGRRSARSVITITADANVEPRTFDLTVVAESRDGISRVARGPGMIVAVKGDRRKPVAFFDLGMQLPAAASEAVPVSLEIGSPAVRISQGFEYVITHRVKESEGARVTGKVSNQIAGAVGNLRILKGEPSKNPNTGSLLLNTNFATPVTVFDMIFTVEAEINGVTQTITAPVMEVQVVPGYALTVPPKLSLTPGGSARVDGTAFRELTFEGGLIRVKAEDLPEGVACKDAEIPAEAKSFTLECNAAATAKPGEYPIRITSVAPDTGRKAKSDYRIPDITAQLAIGESR